MSKAIVVELDESYGEKLDILRKVFVSPEGKTLEKNGELVQGLVDTFMEFIQSHAKQHDEGCSDEGCGCSH